MDGCCPGDQVRIVGGNDEGAAASVELPKYVQQDLGQELYLTEEMAGPPYDADGMYGWAKLMAEMTLRAYHRTYGLRSASCRFFLRSRMPRHPGLLR